MYLRRLSVQSVRSVTNANLEFKPGEEAGWHVILGPNGSGKSSLVQAFAIVMMGEKEAYAARQDFDQWVTQGKDEAIIEAHITGDKEYDKLPDDKVWPKKPIKLHCRLQRIPEARFTEAKFRGEGAANTVWGGANGWFSASFGPFRRFTGSDTVYDQLFLSNKRLAPHLSGLGEGVALTGALNWLSNLLVQSMLAATEVEKKQKSDLLRLIFSFFNKSQFFPNNERLAGIAGTRTLIEGVNDFSISIDQLSDGYRSALSLVFEILRQMIELCGTTEMIDALTTNLGTVQQPGVIFIDEIDVHLHPTWQRDIGIWLTRCFPQIQFIVTTHSPIVCRAISQADGNLRGSIWKLGKTSSGEELRRVTDAEENILIYGDVLDAFSTELFGRNVIRNKLSDIKIERLAELNILALNRKLSPAEVNERSLLRKIFATLPGVLPNDA